MNSILDISKRSWKHLVKHKDKNNSKYCCLEGWWNQLNVNSEIDWKGGGCDQARIITFKDFNIKQQSNRNKTRVRAEVYVDENLIKICLN